MPKKLVGEFFDYIKDEARDGVLAAAWAQVIAVASGLIWFVWSALFAGDGGAREVSRQLSTVFQESGCQITSTGTGQGSGLGIRVFARDPQLPQIDLIRRALFSAHLDYSFYRGPCEGPPLVVQIGEVQPTLSLTVPKDEV